jgi:outer membrane protein OmpA-like peptidoglycan-associated protein
MRTGLLAATSAIALISMVAQAVASPLPRLDQASGHSAGLPLVLVQNVDTRPSKALNEAELRARINFLRDKPKNLKVGRFTASELLRSDRQELQRREAAQANRKKNENQANRNQRNEPNNKAQRNQNELKPIENPPRRQAEPNRPPQAGDQSPAVARLLRDTRAANSLRVEELRERIQTNNAYLQQNRPDPQTRARLENMLTTDQAELRKRLAAANNNNAGQQAGNRNDNRNDNRNPPRADNRNDARAAERVTQADREARRLLSDNRPAQAMTELALQDRIRVSRAVLGVRGLSDPLQRDLRQRLERDKEVLRAKVDERERAERARRIAQSERGKIADPGFTRGRPITIQDLQRRQPRPDELNSYALQDRIIVVRDGFRYDRLTPAERAIYDAQLRNDRLALRNRMLERRLERRNQLNDPTFRITINNTSVSNTVINNQTIVNAPAIVPPPTIPLAEAYDDQLIGQLVAPPIRPIPRPYTINEYRQSPELRDVMPGVEIDTVRFGFNEDFLREEEISKLDRIGEVLERIVAGNPDEVYLIEGHTDLVGGEAYNYDLSLRRAEAVRQALLDFYNIAPRNLEVAGYGETYPLIFVEYDEPENRRVTVRRITPILQGQLR